MTYTTRDSRWPWRTYLTTDESSELASIEQQLERAKDASSQLSHKRLKIVNRALQRAKSALNSESADGRR